MNPLNIIVLSRNVELYIKKCINSLKNQTFCDWKATIVNDCSTDSTLDIINNNIDERFTVISNNERKYMMCNIYNTITERIQDKNSIVAVVDGDDWLCDNDTFKDIVSLHDKYHVVYTQFKILSTGQIGFNRKPTLPLRTPGNYSQLRTYKKFLFDKIKKEDLMLNGSFYVSCCDKAIMYPVTEMCGIDKVFFHDKVCYVYNDNHGDNVHSRPDTLREQSKIATLLFKKPSYECLF